MQHALSFWGFELDYDKEKRLVFGDFVDKAFWLIISSFLLWIGISITSLNEKMAVIVTQISYESRVNAEQTAQIKDLERQLFNAKARTR